MLYAAARVGFNLLTIILIIGLASSDMAHCGYATFVKKPRPKAEQDSFEKISFKYITKEIWQSIRIGLNYLESPRPLDRPEAVLPSYMHPDTKGYGPYGLSPWAYSDVQRCYPFFRQYTWQAILSSHGLYDLASRAYADWLLGKLQSYLNSKSNFLEIFDVLQRAWNLGLRGFKEGRSVVCSRSKRAEEFKNKILNLQRL